MYRIPISRSETTPNPVKRQGMGKELFSLLMVVITRIEQCLNKGGVQK